MKRMLASAVALAVTTFSSFTLIPAAYASPAAVSAQPAPETAGFRLALHALPAHAVLPVRHTVVTGDTLAGLAVTYCHGVANYWTGFYHENRAVIGDNPNLIYPGQVLNLSRCTDPPQLLHLGSTYHAPAHATVHRSNGGKVWGVTYGYPNVCGDGDHDGWDVACHATPVSRVVRHSGSGSAAVTGSSHYSYAGLEALWISAGGPAWAAAHAASIAECESGGNVYAHNPSGATSLWQILGQVVPGNLYNPYINALNAVSKFKASGDNFSAWVCK